MTLSTARISALWKRGWIEIPEIMATTGLALIGVGASATAWALGKRRGTWNRKYKNRPMFMRSDDPRVPHIRKHCGIDD